MKVRLNEINKIFCKEQLFFIIELKTQLEIAETNNRMCKRQIEEKEREILTNVNSANEENWIKINELTNEK